ncbi:MAG: TetR/AcrR family transcriptional regulator [Vicinamibacteria bacterium]
MGIAERKEREKEDVRRKILDAAHDLFETQGYENVTMRAVADAIEYSPTTIYLHFVSKDALVQALCYEDFERLSSAMNVELPVNPIVRMRALGRAYAAFGTRNPNHYRFMFMASGDWKSHARDPEAPPAKSYETLRVAVTEAMEQGYFKKNDIDLVSQIVWAGIHGVVSLLITFEPHQFPRTEPHEGLVDGLTETILHGLLVPEMVGKV